MLVIFSGGSGVGKNTVIAEFLKREEFLLLPTYTTRNKREGESEGNPYYFITKEQFEQKIADGEFYEYENVHGNYYGTSKKLLKHFKETGKILLKDIDVLGTHNLVERIGNDEKLVTIFLKVDSVEVLRQRLTMRGEKEIEKRLSRYEMEQTHQTEYDYIISNNELQTTKGYVDSLIATEQKDATLKTATAKSIDLALVKEYQNSLESGERLSPIKIALSNGEFYILEGHEKYLASLVTNKRVPKEIINDYTVESVCQKDWQAVLATFSK